MAQIQTLTGSYSNTYWAMVSKSKPLNPKEDKYFAHLLNDCFYGPLFSKIDDNTLYPTHQLKLSTVLTFTVFPQQSYHLFGCTLTTLFKKPLIDLLITVF